MTPEERVEQLKDSADLWPSDKELLDMIRDTAAQERQRCIAIIREYLLFNSQRAVSWHEVADTIKAIQENGASLVRS